MKTIIAIKKFEVFQYPGPIPKGQKVPGPDWLYKAFLDKKIVLGSNGGWLINRPGNEPVILSAHDWVYKGIKGGVGWISKKDFEEYYTIQA